jgi:hypothetical protein
VKFTHIFFLFNGIVLIFLLIIGATAFELLGTGAEHDFAPLIWNGIGPLFLAVVFMLGVFDTYFLLNRRLYLLLEREDWPALAAYLHKRIFKDGHYRCKLVRLLAHTYLVLSDAKAVWELEQAVREHKPALVKANGLVFGVARLLGKDIAGAVRLFSALLDAEVSRKKQGGVVFGQTASARFDTVCWIRWYYGFSLLLDRQFARAAEQFLILIAESSTKPTATPLITGLAAFLLEDTLSQALFDRNDIHSAAAAGREQVRNTLHDIAAWNKALSGAREGIHLVILLAYLQEAGVWLYGTANEPKSYLYKAPALNH